LLQIPPAEQGRALYLDSTTGIEHIYVVLSATRWPALEDTLAKAPAGAVAARSVQEPNRLRQRGIGGTRPAAGAAGLADLITLERVHDGATHTVSVGGERFAATGSFLVVERWFRHVAARRGSP
jgi:hypothetical protein